MEQSGLLYVKYKEKAYKIVVNFDWENNIIKTENVDIVYTPKGNEGKDLGEITGNTEYNGWIIIYDNGDTMEAVSPTAMGELGLGNADKTIDWTKTEDANVREAMKEADLDANGSVDYIENSIYSYNHAIERINNYCNNLGELPENIGVRSVGAKDDPTGNDETINIPTDWTNGEIKKYNKKGKKGDIAYEQDLARISYWELEKNGQTGIGKTYWAASRCVAASGSEIYFLVDSVRGDGMVGSENLWEMNASGNVRGIGQAYAVRPIIIVNK